MANPTRAEVAALLARQRGEPEPKPRRKRGEGDTARRKAWESEMACLPGLFVVTRLVSEANQREHWAVRDARRVNQQTAVALIMRSHHMLPWEDFPCVVTLTRYGPRAMDSDNLAGSFKHVQDEVAWWLGVDDGDTARVRWVYRQEQSPPRCYGVRIEIRTADEGEL